jgi:hypothetical protein
VSCHSKTIRDRRFARRAAAQTPDGTSAAMIACATTSCVSRNPAAVQLSSRCTYRSEQLQQLHYCSLRGLHMHRLLQVHANLLLQVHANLLAAKNRCPLVHFSRTHTFVPSSAGAPAATRRNPARNTQRKANGQWLTGSWRRPVSYILQHARSRSRKQQSLLSCSLAGTCLAVFTPPTAAGCSCSMRIVAVATTTLCS